MIGFSVDFNRLTSYFLSSQRKLRFHFFQNLRSHHLSPVFGCKNQVNTQLCNTVTTLVIVFKHCDRSLSIYCYNLYCTYE